MNSVDAEGFCIEQNNETAAGQIVMHTHFHIIPRFKDDNLTHWPSKPTSQQELNQIKEKIEENLNNKI